MSDEAIVGAALAIMAEMRWALARLHARVGLLESGNAVRPDGKGKRAATLGRRAAPLLVFVIAALAVFGCASGVSDAARSMVDGAPANHKVSPSTPDAPALTPAAASSESPATALTKSLPWWIYILGAGGIMAAVAAVGMGRLEWLSWSAGAAVGIGCCMALPIALTLLPWLVGAAVLLFLARLSWLAWKSGMKISPIQLLGRFRAVK